MISRALLQRVAERLRARANWCPILDDDGVSTNYTSVAFGVHAAGREYRAISERPSPSTAPSMSEFAQAELRIQLNWHGSRELDLTTLSVGDQVLLVAEADRCARR